MLYVNAADVHKHLEWKSLVEALHQSHAQNEMPFFDAQYYNSPAKNGDQFLNLTAWSGTESIAVKMVGVFPNNPNLTPAQPSVQGAVVLFSGKTGEPQMICDGEALTYRKTAGDSALGSTLLSRKDSEVLAIAGAGGLAPYVVQAHCAVRPIKKVMIWNRTKERAEVMAEKLRKPGLEVVVVDDFTQALPEADIVSAATMATSPVVIGKYLKPGAHVDLIGAYQPNMREADSDTVRRATRMFGDSRPIFVFSGDGIDPVAEGIIEGPAADYFELCSGKHPGRTSDEEITVCKNAGGPHLDLFVAEHLYRVAR